jgi:chemotaxis protein histidine kinase CheA
MRERVTQLQGEFHIHSSPGKGTTIQVTLPLVSVVPLVIEEKSE